jgi:DNA helicase-2/ATP-dependent DNA helicase PcrA
LVDLVAEVETTIGVGLEIAARPDGDRVGRVHLDRFHDEVATFSAESDRPSLAAFLAFLKVAEEEENGLAQGEAELAPERVQILTVHGAKGLEWDLVAVPGLVNDVFPGKAQRINWTKTKELLPAPLRGDRGELPSLDIEQAASAKEVKQLLEQHDEQTKQRHLTEERRLAYVAFTRARHSLLLTSYCWDTTQKPREVSVFLDDVRHLAERDQWYVPAEDAQSLAKVVETAQWPLDPLGERRARVRAAAELVRTKLADRAVERQTEPAQASPRTGRADAQGAVLLGLVGDALERERRWSDDIDLLLAEREHQRDRDTVEVVLPHTLSVSQLVTLQRQPEELARQLRRPMPIKPAPWARRGTRFHSWLEQRWFSHALLDIDALPGSADTEAQVVDDDQEFEALREAFERSEWGGRTPLEVEVGFDMTIAGTVIRGRMDAVFVNTPQKQGDPEWIVVDWKTGRRPTGSAAQAAAVQLAAYRMAWARICGLGDEELHRVAAAFHYVRDNHTERPVDLLDVQGLTMLLAGGDDPH